MRTSPRWADDQYGIGHTGPYQMAWANKISVSSGRIESAPSDLSGDVAHSLHDIPTTAVN